jgi:ubiquinone/menaquinone biosynthesis C-methylase UbiE
LFSVQEQLLKKPASPDTSRFFNRIATKGWHKSPFFTYTWKYPALRRWLRAQILSSEKRILSIGCGSGEIERDLNESGLEVVGVDNSHEMLRKAAGRGLRDLVLADARHLPFSRASFDLVMFMESVGYVDLEKVLPEVKRVLNKSGRVMITFYPPHHGSDSFCHKVSLPQLAGELRKGGLHIVTQQMLAVKRNGVIPVESEDRSVLLYALAQKSKR